MNKKILFYLPFIKLGGIETLSIQYIKSLVDLGYKVDLLIDYDMGPEGNTFEYSIPYGVNYEYIKSKQISRFIYFLRNIGKKYSIVNLIMYMVILVCDYYYYIVKLKKYINRDYYCTLSTYQFAPSFVTKINSSINVIWLQGSVDHILGGFNTVMKKIYRKKLSKYDLIITTADEMRNQLMSFFPDLHQDKVKMIYNPIDVNEIKALSDDKSDLLDGDHELLLNDYICMASRLDEAQKDFTTLIESYESLYFNKGFSKKLYIIGDGPDKKKLVKLVKSKKLETQVLFLGKKTNPFVWMKNADVFILSTKFEGFGLVVVESMATGTFVISSDCKTGPKEILQHGKCGELFPVGDVVLLSSLILKVSNDNDFRVNKERVAQQRVMDFDRVAITEQLLDEVNVCYKHKSSM